MAKPRELREMDDDLLAETVREARREVFGLRFRHATGELENTAGMRAAKRNLARVLTVARERGIAVETELTASE
jgi:large subunit ribosomal protein L29